jgi:hypothetical protein
MRPLEKLCKELESQLENHSTLNSAVSSASVGWHLQHSLMVMNGVLGTLERSNPADYKWGFNKVRLYIFTLGRIPRGKGRAPQVVNPQTEFNVNDAMILIQKSEKKISRIDLLEDTHNFNHPVFGMLNKKRSLRFVEMHTQHHLSIIADILTK